MNWIAQYLGIVTANVTLPGWVVLAGAVVGAIFVFVLLVRSEPHDNPLTVLVLIGLLLGGMGVGTAIYREIKRSNALWEAADLEKRAAALDVAQAQSGLGCIDADEALEASCEVAVFERPESVAAARGLTRARLALVEDAFAYVNRRKATYLLERVAVWRRPLERDPYGIVASVMLERRNCTPALCPELATIGDVSRITANMQDNRYASVVAKYQALWERAARNRGVLAQPARTGPFGFAVVDHNAQPESAPAEPEPASDNGPPAEPQALVPAQSAPSTDAPLPRPRPSQTSTVAGERRAPARAPSGPSQAPGQAAPASPVQASPVQAPPAGEPPAAQ